jgi:hypothetical protein
MEIQVGDCFTEQRFEWEGLTPESGIWDPPALRWGKARVGLRTMLDARDPHAGRRADARRGGRRRLSARCQADRDRVASGGAPGKVRSTRTQCSPGNC